MAKGSQLSQLKSALNQAGITGKPQAGKKRKRSAVPQEKEKEKRIARLDEIQRKLNPFDVKVTKLKHDVGGRKVKGVIGKPAQSKLAGVEQRKKTLLKEYEEKDRAGGILDRRFGENDPSMSLEERMLERFTKERQRASKGAAFNLEDEDDLTHYGQSLSKLDDFDNGGLGLDDDEEEERGAIDGDIVGRTHFGGFDDDDEDEEDEDGQPARKKSKAEVMAEVMAKSKEYKLRRQMDREKEDSVRQELDKEFDSLRDLIFKADPNSTGSNRIPINPLHEGPSNYQTPAPVANVELEDADYDQHVRELAFDKRAKPKDRTKTDEELALEEKEALEKAERRRRKRMLGLDSDSEDEDGKPKAKRKRGADDLDDDFEDEEDFTGIGGGLEEATGDADEEDDEEDDEDESEEGSEEEGEESEEDSGEEDSEGESGGEEGDPEDLVSVPQGKRDKIKSAGSSAKELPFTFPCPETHDDFLQIIDGIQDTDVPVVIQRIRTLHHTSLALENKFKLQGLIAVLIDHVLYLASQPTSNFVVISAILPHISALSEAYPVQAGEHFVEKLKIMHKNLKRGLSRGALDVEAKTWPALPELSILRIIGAIWSTSDMNHAVISPTRVLMGAYLGLGRVRSIADIASGLFLCTLFLQFEELSKRLVPEAVNFLVNTVLHLAPHRYTDISELPGSFPSPDFLSDLCRPLRMKGKTGPNVLEKPDLFAVLSAEEPSETNKGSLLSLALELLRRYADMYKGIDGFVELYSPILEVVQHLEQKKLGSALQIRVKALAEALERLLKFSKQARRPLYLQAHKPIPIATFIPKFEARASSYLRHQDPDHERKEASKLRNQYKQERKGAIRELRKDARFLAGVEQKKQAEKDRGYNERMKRVMGSIEGERAEEKAMEREKAKEKKRSGRK